jgi:hypothetical protein
MADRAAPRARYVPKSAALMPLRFDSARIMVPMSHITMGV